MSTERSGGFERGIPAVLLRQLHDVVAFVDPLLGCSSRTVLTSPQPNRLRYALR